MSSEDFMENPQLEKPPTPGGFQNTEALGSPVPSVKLSQLSDIHHGSQPFTKLNMHEIEKMFEEDKTGALDLEAFIKATKKVLGRVSDEMLEALFLKVDSDCNGIVTWEECMDYMMREFQGKEEMRKNKYRLHFSLPMKVVPLNHGCEVVKVDFLVHCYKKKGYFKKTGCFLTVTKDGVLQFWSETFLLIKSFQLSLQLHNQQILVTDMVCLHNLNLVAVASTEQKIEFFDISNDKCVRSFTFIDLDSCVLVMDYWSDGHRGVFCSGDTKGSVMIFTSDNVTNGLLFNPKILPKTSRRDHWMNISMQQLLNEKSTTYRNYQMKGLHRNWCQQVKFIPQLNLVGSCSAIEKSSLVLIILPSKVPEKPKLLRLHLKKGVLCFNYCPDTNFLVTGGYDSFIRLWNPFFSRKPMLLMKGHQTSVTHIVVSSKNNSVLISISKDKNIRVWDMQDRICLQSFCGKFFALGNCPITSAYFHGDDTLICSTYSIGILKGYLKAQGPLKGGKITTHNAPLCAVLYSKVFKQVVSGCLHGSVSVWEVVTGRKMMEFSVSGAQHVELTTMALNESERCLLTGLRDGTMKMWNYNIGECLLAFPNPDHLEITGIIHMNKMFYVTGWSKRITYYMFHQTEPVLLCYHWQTYHAEDVLSMAKYKNQFFGTSSYNGDILFWDTDAFKPTFKFNASQSPSPLPPRRVGDMNKRLVESHRPSKPCIEEEKWAYKAPKKFLGSGARTATNANLRRNLMSAPPVMRPERVKGPERPVSQQKQSSAGACRQLGKSRGRQAAIPGVNVRKEESQKVLLQSGASSSTMSSSSLSPLPLLSSSSLSVEKVGCAQPGSGQSEGAGGPGLGEPTSLPQIIFLQTRPCLPHTAALLSSCSNGYIYAWSIHAKGGLLGRFPVDLKGDGDIVVGAMATDKNDWILITGDCKGQIKIWDIKDYCVFSDQLASQFSGAKGSSETENKFRVLIPPQPGINFSRVPLDEKEVVAGQTISLVPPLLLITWKAHLDSVADVLYVDSFQLVISAGQDQNVKAWKVSGKAIGTFGLSVWKRLQDAPDDLHEQKASFEKIISTGITTKAFHQELQEEKDLAAALVYQKREQTALLALLDGAADTEAHAWAKLQKLSLMSPWAGVHSPKEIEDSWSKWESQGKQVSKVLGTAYKPKRHGQKIKVLPPPVQYGWMKHQIFPRIFQSLPLSKMTPAQQPDFRVSRALLVSLAPQHVQKGLETDREQEVTDVTASMGTTPSSPSSLLSMAASALASTSPTVSRPQSSSFMLRPWSASAAQSTHLVPSPMTKSSLQRSVTSVPNVASLGQFPRPLKTTSMSSVKKGSHIRF
ncbi:EF-hand calcium-binding domain-containing protein 8 [Nycticebus coucang]|uniref:EF-hand calcium-binding domain-containing protein 8 n=1 Tax=Nycticebus coucang TaxID=9470 RepID=UPI00234CA0A0|nr:EF-hand calcium-binding domain-containing protein 8 [Nycticebus coucang]